ncbi:hypothetical protein FR483_n831L [Paramecium bursaria Chlorella virus FR483]|uniref:Uncharacterized protein n831L n=1 Tax=Paramecium bursaria Chlorella virus FR483 TaxID=399781 RepID=A7J8I5_PBCVF|nr:hypothetical protein FR483_n831L [Paramecium bursaria Chlorella virus FR483]ABT16116.1 hypothetical protein FR483_n831L [Paramecium bursaria Chlorella virus FR483]
MREAMMGAHHCMWHRGVGVHMSCGCFWNMVQTFVRRITTVARLLSIGTQHIDPNFWGSCATVALSISFTCSICVMTSLRVALGQQSCC